MTLCEEIMQLSTTLPTNLAITRRMPWALGLFYFAAGMAPIGALSLSIFGVWTLPTGTLVLVMPAIVSSLLIGMLYPVYGRLALKGFCFGVIAVTLYDCTRVPFIVTGIWGDFIPKIGGWLLSRPEPHWALGYLWRYIGNGGGMGIAFTVPYTLWLAHDQQLHSSNGQRLHLKVTNPRRTITIATSYGVGIWCCLLITLLLSTHGQEMLFRLTPLSFVLSLMGHLVFGAVLGILIADQRPEQVLTTL
jgi:hypothetical protein